MTDQQTSEQEAGTPTEFIQRDIFMEPAATRAQEHDQRLYIAQPAGWEAPIKQSWEQEYCYSKNPGEDWFHLLANGELYIQRGTEKFCLTCALRLKILTRDRLFWQKGTRGPADE